MSKKFRQWVKRYQDDAWSLARYLLKDASEAEDATQEAFIKLWNQREELDPERIKPWLLKVTRNVCLDRLRHRRLTPERDAGGPRPGGRCATRRTGAMVEIGHCEPGRALSLTGGTQRYATTQL